MLHHRLRAAAGRQGGGGGIPTDGLIAWYTMDNRSGSTLIDEMGNYNGTISGATQTAGIIGQALSFGGDGDRVTNVANTSQAVAMSFWCRPSSVGGDATQALMNQSMSTNTTGRFVLATATGVALASRDASGEYLQTTEIPAEKNSTHHVYALFDGAELRLRVNDSDEVSLLMSSFDPTPTTRWVVGTRANQALTNRYSGWIDQLRFYNRPLTAAEITALYNEA